MEFLPQLCDDLDAIGPIGKVKIGDDEIGTLCRRKCNDAIGCADRAMTGVTQQHFEKFENGGIIVDDENSGRSLAQAQWDAFLGSRSKRRMRRS